MTSVDEIWTVTGPPLPAPEGQPQPPSPTQRWVRDPATGRFTDVQVGSKRVLLNGRDPDLAEIGTRFGCPNHPWYWPHTFRRCPMCGTALDRQRLPDPRALPWSAPFGTQSGLPVLPRPVETWAGEVRATREAVGVPQPADLMLFAAGAPVRLHAYNRNDGHLWVFDTDRFEEAAAAQRSVPTSSTYAPAAPDAWDRLDLHLPAAGRLPRWAFGIAGTADGFALPSAEGPLWVTALPDQPRTLQGVAGWGRADQCLGAPAILSDLTLMPVVRQGASLLATRRRLDADWSEVPIPGPSLSPDSPFAPPVCLPNTAWWVSAQGVLSALRTPRGLVTQFTAWPPGMEPILAYRPAREATGTFHQAVRVDDTIRWVSLDPDGLGREAREVRGHYAPIGAVSFRDRELYGLPWDPRPPTGYYAEEDEFLWPLLAFGEETFLLAACNQRPTLRSFLEGGPTVRRVRLLFSRGYAALEAAGATFPEVQSPADLQAVVVGPRIFVYEARAQQCWRWLWPNRLGAV